MLCAHNDLSLLWYRSAVNRIPAQEEVRVNRPLRLNHFVFDLWHWSRMCTPLSSPFLPFGCYGDLTIARQLALRINHGSNSLIVSFDDYCFSHIPYRSINEATPMY